ALIDVGQRDRVAQAERASVGLLLPGDHAEERGLAGPVRADDADETAARQREVEPVDQQPVAVALAQALGLDNEIAGARSGGNRDLGGALPRLARLVLGQELLVLREARLALGLASPRRHAHPLQLALQRAPARRGLLLLLPQALLLLLEPGRVVAFPRNPRPAIQLQDPAGDAVDEVAVLRDRG